MRHIYFCSPSMPITCSEEEKARAVRNLEKLGFSVMFSEHAFENHGNVSSSIENRVEDLIEGFTNPTYDIVSTMVGGFNSNEILPFIDFGLLKKYPKPFVGMSDITTLCVNLWLKSGIPTYYGMGFRNFYISENVSNYQDYVSILSCNPFTSFFDNYITEKNVLRHGKMDGVLVGGNLALLCWLAGTSYELQVPENAVLFLEDDDETNGYYWQMYLTHLKQIGVFEKVSGIIFGKVLPKTKFINGSDFITILHHVLDEYSFPILIDANFGHINFPRTIPYGIKYSLQV